MVNMRNKCVNATPSSHRNTKARGYDTLHASTSRLTRTCSCPAPKKTDVAEMPRSVCHGRKHMKMRTHERSTKGSVRGVRKTRLFRVREDDAGNGDFPDVSGAPCAAMAVTFTSKAASEYPQRKDGGGCAIRVEHLAYVGALSLPTRRSESTPGTMTRDHQNGVLCDASLPLLMPSVALGPAWHVLRQRWHKPLIIPEVSHMV